MNRFPHSRTRRLWLTAALGALTAAAQPALAQEAAKDYPSKVITMIVPYAAGGSSDTRARQLAEKIGGYLGKTVIVENKPGAGGNIGTEAIARANPDGYTIGIGNFAPLSVNKALFPKMGYDAIRDLAPIILIERGPLVLVVPEKSPLKTMKDFIANAKANSGKVSYASAGSGGAYHLAGELLEDTIGTKMIHVPYKGGGPAVNDLIAGTVDFMFDMLPSTTPYIKSAPARMRALAVATDKRLPQLPDVPTLAESGLQGMEMSNWFGVIAPKGVPAPIIAKLNAALNKALQDPELAQRITGPGNIIGGGTPEAFASFVAAESVRWQKLIKDRGIKPE
ncbi:Tripartite tricarboxylate transporter substrate binding protein [Rubrivivax sp. A210]|uniref:Bug family tripartite tricarboxylate transporter substrate binding protein n=1 Tax=Rubrivivax sp. A210 TaxID=2772301 RepID=UPI0019198BF5|nr:tripartite tricarboxylate transporter substrate binding protein [Rubrivivax sp. A210]CAD5371641.1 Tripartite tricarboxylate transporter substrate binding protein [Rubrivivax sp. A210]